MSKIIVFGASSKIAEETIKCFAKDKHEILLVGRNENKLNSLAMDLNVRYSNTNHTLVYDFNNIQNINEMYNKCFEILKSVDIIFIAYGSLANQREIEKNVNEIVADINLNATSIIAISSLFGNYFEEKKSGTIAVISSVAGDRGRQSNYIYGSAKGFLSIFLQGLRNRLFKSNVHVLTIKPGFVDTPMTADLPKNPLFASPESVGKSIYNAILNKKDILYVPGFWKYIMMVIKSIPEFIFKKLPL